ncbi:MAG: M15 family metallopeptidase [Acidimicrobiia bacterium]
MRTARLRRVMRAATTVVAAALLATLAAACGAGGGDTTTGSTAAALLTTGPSAPTSVGPVATTAAAATVTAPATTTTAATATTALAGTGATPPASAPPVGAPPTTAAPTTATPATEPTSTEPPSTAPPSTAPPAAVRYEGPDGFVATARPIDAALRARMEPTSWRPGCPVGLEELRYLELGHIGFDGAAHTGELVVHADAVDPIVTVFQRLWTAGFPIRRLRLIDDYGGDDFASIEADNTSAFNCRYVAGTTRWSNHATGRAIDINPLENPYVSGGRTEHPASVPYLDRNAGLPGMIVEGGPVVAAFYEVGWGWGGRWGGDLDHQHFSASGS